MPPKRKREETVGGDTAIIIDERSPVTTTKKTKLTQEEQDYELAQLLQPRECTICLEEQDLDFFHTLETCQHIFCRDCLADHLATQISASCLTVNCPEVGCPSEIPVSEMELLVEPSLVEKYTECSFKSFVQQHADTYSCCPTRDCDYLFFYNEGDSHDFKCAQCAKRYCLKCRVEYHTNATCEQYQQWSLENGQSDDLFGDLVKGQKMKQCSRCRNWIQKTLGCDHITCRCGNQFCYRCGQKWPHVKCGADVAAVIRPAPAPVMTKKKKKNKRSNNQKSL